MNIMGCVESSMIWLLSLDWIPRTVGLKQMSGRCLAVAAEADIACLITEVKQRREERIVEDKGG